MNNGGNIVRTTLFLYPSLNGVPSEEQEQIMEFIAQLKMTVLSCNQEIKNIISHGCFSEVKCLPNVDIEEIDKVMRDPTKFDIKNPERIRICVVGYNNKNYESAYESICEQYHRSDLRISHLVGLKINTECNKVRFFKPKASKFDVIIETGLIDIEKILISVMVDIFLYHYFNMSNDIEQRRHFSEPKAKYIIDSGRADVYGDINDLQAVGYLPFSYYYMIRNDMSNNDEAVSIKKMAQDYFDMIIDNKGTKLDISSQGIPIDYQKTKNINDVHIDLISQKVKESKIEQGRQYILIIMQEKADTQVHLICRDEILDNWTDMNIDYDKVHGLYVLSIGG